MLPSCRCLWTVLLILLSCFCLKWLLIRIKRENPRLVHRMVLRDIQECSSEEPKIFNVARAKEILKNLCDLYNHRKISGDFCPMLCYNSSSYIMSDFNEDSEKVVFSIQKGNRKFTLRSRFPFFEDFDLSNETLSDTEIKAEILKYTEHHLQWKWPKEFEYDLLRTVWPLANRIYSSKMIASDKTSLISLIQQYEYMFFQLMKLARVTPEVLGTCGHMYAVDELQSLGTARRRQFRRKLKSRIMSTFVHLHTNFDHPIEWCDVNATNLGEFFNGRGRFAVTDGNHLYTSEKLRSIFEQMPCRTDADCFVKKCQSICTSTGFCSPNRRGTTFDEMCRKIYQSMFGFELHIRYLFSNACNNMQLSSEERVAIALRKLSRDYYKNDHELL